MNQDWGRAHGKVLDYKYEHKLFFFDFNEEYLLYLCTPVQVRVHF